MHKDFLVFWGGSWGSWGTYTQAAVVGIDYSQQEHPRGFILEKLLMDALALQCGRAAGTLVIHGAVELGDVRHSGSVYRELVIGNPCVGRACLECGADGWRVHLT